MATLDPAAEAGASEGARTVGGSGGVAATSCLTRFIHMNQMGTEPRGCMETHEIANNAPYQPFSFISHEMGVSRVLLCLRFSNFALRASGNTDTLHTGHLCLPRAHRENCLRCLRERAGVAHQYAVVQRS